MTYTIEITQEHIDRSKSKWVRYPTTWSVKKGSPYDYHEAAIMAEKVERFTLDDFIDGCPLEDAFNEQLPKHLGVTVHLYTHKSAQFELWDSTGSSWSRSVPITFARAVDFIKRHRTGKTIKPFTFIIDL